MNGVFSPIMVCAAVAFCTVAPTKRVLADDAVEYGSVKTAVLQRFESGSEPKTETPLATPPAVLGALSEEQAPVLRACDEALPSSKWFASPQILCPDDAACAPIVCGHILTVGLSNEPLLSQNVLSVEKEDATKDTAKPTTSDDTIGFVARPLSSIRLAEVNNLVSRSGERLQIPDTTKNKSASGHYKEEHITPMPWCRAHANRNTFAFKHQPLYFEDPNLERCGQSAGCLTEAVNIIHFGGRIPLLGYMMGADPPCQCVHALPDCPTCHSFGPEAYVPSPTLHSIAAQTAATVGFIFLIP